MLVHIFNRFLGDSTSRQAYEKNASEASLEKIQAFDYEHNDSVHDVSIDEINNRNAMWCYLRAALRGDQEAQYKMGLSYLNGQLGLDRSYSHAEKWLEQAAHQGHFNAQEQLKKVYDELAFS